MTGFSTQLAAAIQVNGAWADISGYVYDRGGNASVTTRSGRADETQQVQPSSATGELNNRDARFTARNPSGPYYPYFTRNTPLRFSAPYGTTHLRLENDRTSYIGCPDAAGLQLTTGVIIQMDIQPSDYQQSLLAAKWSAAGQAWAVTLNPDGTLGFNWWTGSVQFGVGSTATIPVGRFSLQVSFNLSSVTFSVGGPGYTGMTQLGNVISFGATTLSGGIGAGIQVGDNATIDPSVFTQGFNGRVYSFFLKNISATTVASGTYSSQTAGTTSFTDAQSNVWSVAGTAELTDRSYRYHGELAELPVSWNTKGSDIWLPFTAGGVLRRLQQGTSPVASPMKRAIQSLSGESAPVAYWPCEDLAGASQFGTAVSGGAPLTFTSASGLSLSADSSFICSAPLPTIGSAAFTGQVIGGSWHDNVFRFLFTAAAGVVPNNGIIAVMFTTGVVARIHLRYGTGGALELIGYNAAGTQILTTGTGGFNIDGAQCRIGVNIKNNGTNSVVIQVEVYQLGGASQAALTSPSTSGTIGQVTRIVINPGAVNMGAAVFGHGVVQSRWLTDLFDVENNHAADGTLTGPLRAWEGETAGNRFTRLCRENSITSRIYGPPNTTVPMGAQQIDTLSNLLQQVADADQGDLYEPLETLAIGYRTVASKSGQTSPAVTLDASLAQVGDQEGSPAVSLASIDDDQYTTNDWTVTNGNASSVRKTLDDGSSMSIGSIGDYTNSKTVWLYQDTQLDDAAGWRLHVTTTDEERYPQVVTGLHRQPIITANLAPAILDARVGDLIEIINTPAWLPPGPIRLIIAGISETMTTRLHQVSWNTVPASPYDVILLGDATYGRLDTAASQLTVPAGSAAGTLTVTTGIPPAWTTQAGDMPFNVNVGGEICTVTGVAAAGRKQCRVGAFLNPAAMGHSTWSQASTAWNTLTGQTPDVTRVYLANSYPINADMTAMITAGTRMLISIQPDFNPPSASTLATIATWLQNLVAAGADCVIAMWSEPYYSNLNSGGPNAAQYKAIYQYYGPTIRAVFPLAVVFSTGSIYFNDEASFYPGDDQCDQFAVDFYCTSPFIGATLDAPAAIAPSKPFGIWEFNGATDPINGQTSGQITTFIQYIQSFMAQRESLGYPCADICLFNGAPQSSFLGDGTTQNAGFEGGLGNWTAAGSSTVALVTTQAHSGADSMGVTSTAAGSVQAASCTAANIATQGMPVTPGQLLHGAAWAKAATTGRSFEVGFGFYTSGGVAISNLYGSTTPDVTTGWTQATTGASGITVPATAAFARLLVQFLSEAAAGEVHWVDDCEMRIVPASNDLTNTIEFAWDFRVALWQTLRTALDGTSAPQTFTVTRSVNGVVKAHPAGEDVRLAVPPILALT